jgi:hypothetical protein
LHVRSLFIGKAPLRWMFSWPQDYWKSLLQPMVSLRHPARDFTICSYGRVPQGKLPRRY